MARLWAVGLNEPIQTLTHMPAALKLVYGNVNGAVFNPDESRILTWSGDGTARLWDISLDEKIPPDERILRSDEVLRIKMRIDRFPIGP